MKQTLTQSMFNLGWAEVILIALAVLLIFGPKKIPEIGKALGQTLRGFKEEVKKSDRDNNDSDEA